MMKIRGIPFHQGSGIKIHDCRGIESRALFLSQRKRFGRVRHLRGSDPFDFVSSSCVGLYPNIISIITSLNARVIS